MTSKGWQTLMDLKAEIEKGDNIEIAVNVVRTMIMRDVGLDDRTIALYIKRLRGLRVLGDSENPNYFRVVSNDKKYESENYVLSEQERDFLKSSSDGSPKELESKKEDDGVKLRPRETSKNKKKGPGTRGQSDGDGPVGGA